MTASLDGGVEDAWRCGRKGLREGEEEESGAEEEVNVWGQFHKGRY